MNSVLAIAGSDSSGGAGLQCDIRTISSLNLHVLSVVTSVTSQNSEGVHSSTHMDSRSVYSQLTSAFSAYSVDAVKSGMIPTQESVETICDALQQFHGSKPFVLDPVLKTTSGTILMAESVRVSVIDRLFPLATVVTPNIEEAQELSGIKISTREDAVMAGRELLKHGSQYVLIKGGHLHEAPGLDILVGPSQDSPVEFVNGHKFVENRNVRGTGCAYASAIACGLATGLDILESVYRAKNYISRAILNARRLSDRSWILNHRWSDPI